MINKVTFHIKNKKFNFEIIKLLADSPVVSRLVIIFGNNIWSVMVTTQENKPQERELGINDGTPIDYDFNTIKLGTYHTI